MRIKLKKLQHLVHAQLMYHVIDLFFVSFCVILYVSFARVGQCTMPGNTHLHQSIPTTGLLS